MQLSIATGYKDLPSGTVTHDTPIEPSSVTDIQMESPKGATLLPLHNLCQPSFECEAENHAGVDAACDLESIAFGVMYFPRTRVQRTDLFTCDTRV